jgi:hypothetical protein
MFSIYVKPILKDVKGNLANALLGRLKYNLARAGKKYISEASKKSFKGKGTSIRKGIFYTIGKKSITFHLTAIGVFHDSGVRQHKMKYLMKAKRPIPIKLKTGDVIFRWASAKSMKRKGSWTHPGIKPKKFAEEGIKKLKDEFRERLITESSKYIRGKK